MSIATKPVRLIRFGGHLPKVETMSRPMADTSTQRRPRRFFDENSNEQPERPVLDQGKSVGGAARDVDLTESSLRRRSTHRPMALTFASINVVWMVRVCVLSKRWGRVVFTLRKSTFARMMPA